MLNEEDWHGFAGDDSRCHIPCSLRSAAGCSTAHFGRDSHEHIHFAPCLFLLGYGLVYLPKAGAP